LLGDLVVTPAGQLPQPPAAIRASEPADRHGHAVDQGELRVEVDLAQQVLAQLLLGRPQIRRLAHEADAVDARKGREPVTPVAAEVLMQADIGVDAQELTDAFDGENLAVGQGWPGTRWRRRWPANQSSIRQNTVTMKS
jgi:hypothetical protein